MAFLKDWTLFRHHLADRKTLKEAEINFGFELKQNPKIFFFAKI